MTNAVLIKVWNYSCRAYWHTNSGSW